MGKLFNMVFTFLVCQPFSFPMMFLYVIDMIVICDYLVFLSLLLMLFLMYLTSLTAATQWTQAIAEVTQLLPFLFKKICTNHMINSQKLKLFQKLHLIIPKYNMMVYLEILSELFRYCFLKMEDMSTSLTCLSFGLCGAAQTTKSTPLIQI